MPDAPSLPYHSKVWLLDGPIDSLPGVLSFDGKRLRFLVLESGTFPRAKLHRTFEACGQSLTKDHEPTWPHVLINVTRAEIRSFHIPWYYFGGGAVIDLGHGPMRFSFIRPQNTVSFSHYSEHLQQWVGGEGQEEVNIPEGKLAGKRWRTLLT